jgi:hypothetical protein
MKVDVSFDGPRVRYGLELDEEDRDRILRDVPFREEKSSLVMVSREYEVVLPAPVERVHPDLHALALLLVLRPFVGRTLRLPFAVSTPLAEIVQRERGVTLAPVDTRLKSRRRPASSRTALLFSAGMDSAAASVVCPEDTIHLFLDRIPLAGNNRDTHTLVDLVHQRSVCRQAEQLGRRVLSVRDGHEQLFRPYPTWHTEMKILPVLYLADALDLGAFATGDVLCAIHFGGYQERASSSWSFRRPERGSRHEALTDSQILATLEGIESVGCVEGLSEVATAIVVSRSPYADKTASCYYRSEGSYCMRCDKCFKKILLMHIARGQETPAALFEHFLAFDYLADIFSRPYFDWHHVWYYIFQRVRCDHWFVRELQRQAREGPDLSLLEKWYPRDLEEADAGEWGATIRQRICRYVQPMSNVEIRRLEGLDVPPLHAPPLPHARPLGAGLDSPLGGGRAAPAGSAGDSAVAVLANRVRALLTPAHGAAPEFAGFGVTLVTSLPDSRRVLVRLARSVPAAAPVELLLEVSPASTAEPCFRRAGDWAVSYRTQTPLDLPSRRHALASLLRFLAARS